MSDYWLGYNQGKSNSSAESGAAIGIAILLLAVGTAIAAAAMGYIFLYPLAAAIVLAVFVTFAWGLSALAGVLWHDPSPNFLFDNHWLYINPVGVGAAGILGLFIAWYAVTLIEFRLAANPAYYGVRHLWRVLAPAAVLAEVLVQTKDSTGITQLGVWGIPLVLAVILHFVLWREVFSLRERWLEEHGPIVFPS